MKKMAFVVTEDWYFLSHRLPMARAALAAGFDVHLIARSSGLESKIAEQEVSFHPLPFNRGGLSAFSILKEAWLLLWLLFKIRPNLIHFVAVRPILLGSLLVPFTLNIPKIFAFAGLGALFSGTKTLELKRKVVSFVLKHAFKAKNTTILFQNTDDMQEMKALLHLRDEQITLIRGSGVELEQYSVAPPQKIFTIGLVARMLKSKGIEEAIEASKLLDLRKIPHKLLLAGECDEGNPDSFNRDELAALLTPSVTWLGFVKDIPNFWNSCSVAILPQREREGLPKSLLEAAASSLPIITTDVAGCRDVVIDNGFVIPPMNAEQLSESLLKLYSNQELAREMGQNSRKMVETHFSSELIKAQTLALYCRHK